MAMEVKAGSRVGPYELLSPLGAGGMGEVWKARDTRLERTVAMKFSREGFSERFQREARAIAALNHPNIATLHDVGDDYLVMEFVDGEPVRAPGDVRKLLDIAVQIADGLAAAHAAGIVHRDLKPDNILLAKTGRVKILDFGLAKRSAAPGPDEATIKATQRGTVMGTVAYMSPEQARGEELGVQSDQFSFGQVLYELAAGKRAFIRPSAAETMAAIIRDDAEPLPATLPAPLRWVIERLLAKDPADRYDTTRGLYLELASLRGRISEVTTQARAAPASRGRWWKPAVLGACVVAALLLISWVRQPWQPDLSRYRFVPFATENYPEYSAVWSPDGRAIAYCAIAEGEYRLMVKALDGNAPAVLARHRFTPGGFIDLDHVSWSADGSRLFYHVRGQPYQVARAGGLPQTVPNPNGELRRIMPAPDGKTFAVTQVRAGERVRSSLGVATSANGEGWKPLFEPESTIGELSWASDSSRMLVTESASAGFKRLWLVDRAGGAKLVRDGLSAGTLKHSWLPGRRAVVLALTPADVGLSVMDTSSGEMTPILPSTTPVASVSVSPDGSRIAYTAGQFRTSLVELPLSGAQAKVFLSSSVNHSELAWSPGGDEFVFVRGEEIHVRNRSGSLDRTVVSRRDFPAHRGELHFEKPSFSPDGQRILYTLFGAQGRTQGIWISPASGGPPAVIDKAEGFAPLWSRDGAFVIFNPPRKGLWRYRLGSDEAPVQISARGCDPSPSPDGRWFLCPANMTIVSSDGKETRTLGKPAAVSGTWSKDSQSVFVLSAAEPQELSQIDIGSGRKKVISTFAQAVDVRGPFGGPTRMVLSPDGESLITTARQMEGDIWILEGFTPPRGLLDRIWPGD